VAPLTGSGKLVDLSVVIPAWNEVEGLAESIARSVDQETERTLQVTVAGSEPEMSLSIST